MSYTDLLIETCDVERFTQHAQDEYGIPVRAWAVHLDDTPCRLSRAMRTGLGGSAKEVEMGVEVVIAPYTLFLGDVDVTEQDRIVIGAITYEILLVENKADSFGSHHKQCLIRTTR